MKTKLIQFSSILVAWYMLSSALIWVLEPGIHMGEFDRTFVLFLLVLVPLAMTLGFIIAMIDNKITKDGAK